MTETGAKIEREWHDVMLELEKEKESQLNKIKSDHERTMSLLEKQKNFNSITKGGNSLEEFIQATDSRNSFLVPLEELRNQILNSFIAVLSSTGKDDKYIKNINDKISKVFRAQENFIEKNFAEKKIIKEEIGEGVDESFKDELETLVRRREKLTMQNKLISRGMQSSKVSVGQKEIEIDKLKEALESKLKVLEIRDLREQEERGKLAIKISEKFLTDYNEGKNNNQDLLKKLPDIINSLKYSRTSDKERIVKNKKLINSLEEKRKEMLTKFGKTRRPKKSLQESGDIEPSSLSPIKDEPKEEVLARHDELLDKQEVKLDKQEVKYSFFNNHIEDNEKYYLLTTEQGALVQNTIEETKKLMEKIDEQLTIMSEIEQRRVCEKRDSLTTRNDNLLRQTGPTKGEPQYLPTTPLLLKNSERSKLSPEANSPQANSPKANSVNSPKGLVALSQAPITVFNLHSPPVNQLHPNPSQFHVAWLRYPKGIYPSDLYLQAPRESVRFIQPPPTAIIPNMTSPRIPFLLLNNSRLN